MVASSAPITVEKTRNWLTGALVKPEDIIATGGGSACASRRRVLACGCGVKWCNAMTMVTKAELSGSATVAVAHAGSHSPCT